MFLLRSVQPLLNSGSDKESKNLNKQNTMQRRREWETKPYTAAVKSPNSLIICHPEVKCSHYYHGGRVSGYHNIEGLVNFLSNNLLDASTATSIAREIALIQDSISGPFVVKDFSTKVGADQCSITVYSIQTLISRDLVTFSGGVAAIAVSLPATESNNTLTKPEAERVQQLLNRKAEITMKELMA